MLKVGVYFGVFWLGEVFEYAVRGTVLETGNTLVRNMMHKHTALHTDHDYCQSTPLGEHLASST